MIQIQGIPLKLIDTAGIRNTNDEIEKIGVEKALKLSENADLIISIFDNTKALEEEDIQILDIIKNKKAIILLNKVDEKDVHLENEEIVKNTNKPIIKISAKKQEGLDKLYNQILDMFKINEIELNNSDLIINARHKNQIIKAIDSIEEAKDGIKNNMPIDVVSVSIKQSLEELSSITGENVSDDIISEIFSKFCLGK